MIFFEEEIDQSFQKMIRSNVKAGCLNYETTGKGNSLRTRGGKIRLTRDGINFVSFCSISGVVWPRTTYDVAEIRSW